MREDFFGFEMREVVGDFMEAPSWGSAFLEGWYAMSLQGIKAEPRFKRG